MSRLVCISSYPPSNSPLSSFGYYAINNFSQSNIFDEIHVICDQLPVNNNSEDLSFSGRENIFIHRCWQYNRILTFRNIITKVISLKPDIIWLNLSYTSLGKGILASLLGVLMPFFFKFCGYVTVVLLHNYISGVKLTEVEMRLCMPPSTLMFFDRFLLKTLAYADQLIVMTSQYKQDLSKRIPNANIQLVEHDLYPTDNFIAVDGNKMKIMTMGYFGTYKKLEPLIEAFSLVNQMYPNAVLSIAGMDSPHTQGYLSTLRQKYASNIKNVEFLGYIETRMLKEVFLESNLIVITNKTSAGSSAIVEYCRAFGRPILIPQQLGVLDNWPTNIPRELITYDLSCPNDLAEKICRLLGDINVQNYIGRNLLREENVSHQSHFSESHKRIFLEML